MNWSELKLNSDGHLPVVVQDFETGVVLMVGYMNEESYLKTLETREMWYFSRSRQELWHKGATSGHIQKVKELWMDCDSDTLLAKVDQVGKSACHTGSVSCFFSPVTLPVH
ncbi:MAG: phosphoribosyl-AMP cyclohydrolase [Bacteroidetes bacterium]|nr:phosphoribosyl-AMP cyclohydrolase [Bacteroidota bacterium]